jgi:hypothetical protein
MRASMAEVQHERAVWGPSTEFPRVAPGTPGTSGTPGKPFQKGKSGNPGGRPKEMEPELKQFARAHTKEAIERLVWWMKSDNPKASRFAAKELLDRGWGRAPQYHEHSGDLRDHIKSVLARAFRVGLRPKSPRCASTSCHALLKAASSTSSASGSKLAPCVLVLPRALKCQVTGLGRLVRIF